MSVFVMGPSRLLGSAMVRAAFPRRHRLAVVVGKCAEKITNVMLEWGERRAGCGISG